MRKNEISFSAVIVVEQVGYQNTFVTMPPSQIEEEFQEMREVEQQVPSQVLFKPSLYSTVLEERNCV